MSLQPEVVNPSGHSRTMAGNALMEDDNGLTAGEKAKMMAIFAKDAAFVDMYLVSRRDEELRKELIRTFLASTTTMTTS